MSNKFFSVPNINIKQVGNNNSSTFYNIDQSNSSFDTIDFSSIVDQTEEEEQDEEFFDYDFFQDIGIFFQKLFGQESIYLSKEYGRKCFEASGLIKSIPDNEDIKEVYIDGSNIMHVKLNSGEDFRFCIYDNNIKLSGAYDKNHLFVNYNLHNTKIVGINFTSDGCKIETIYGTTYYYKPEDYTYEHEGEVFQSRKYVLSSFMNKNDSSFQFSDEITQEDEDYVNGFFDYYEKYKNSFLNFRVSSGEKKREINESLPINGYISHTISTENGSKTFKIYWVGDQLNYEEFVSYAEVFSNMLDSYPDNVKDFILNSKLDNFMCGGAEDINDDTTYNAFTSPYDDDNHNTYLFFDYNTRDPDVVFHHEMGHVLWYDYFYKISDGLWSRGDRVIVQKNKGQMKVEYELYNEYKEDIQQLDNIHYMNEGGVPTYEEFFAELTSEYFTQPDELKQLLPDCYKYIEDFYKNLQYDPEK